MRDQREAGHFGHGDGQVVEQVVARRGDQHHAVFKQLGELQGAVIVGRGGAEGQVDFARFHQLDEVGVGTGHQPHPYVGVAGAELPDGARQVVGHDVGIGADDERAAPFGVVHLRFQRVDGCHDGRHQFVENRPLRGELYRPLDAVEQRDAELAFQLPQVGGHGGLAQLQFACRFGHAAEARHMVKADNLAQFH